MSGFDGCTPRDETKLIVHKPKVSTFRSGVLAIGQESVTATSKSFIAQCERTGVPEHFTASLVGRQSARSENKLTYGLYSAGISDTQKREIIDQVRLPQDVVL